MAHEWHNRPSAFCDRRAFALTRSGANIDLHNFGRAYDEWHIDRVLPVIGALLPSPVVAPTSTSIILDVRTMNGTLTGRSWGNTLLHARTIAADSALGAALTFLLMTMPGWTCTTRATQP
jgi:hypothetical protein